LFGASTWGIFSDKYGRRRGYFFVTVFTFLWGFIGSFAPSLEWFLLFRCLGGFGVGGVHVAFTLFAEFSPLKHRAGALILIQLFWALGSMLSAVLAMELISGLGWRWYLIVSSIPFALLTFVLPWVPESPRYLLANGKVEAATKVLQQAATDNGRALPLGTLANGATVNPDGVQQGRFLDLLAPTIRRTTVLLWFIWFACAFSYYGMVLMVTELFSEERQGTRCPNYGVASQKPLETSTQTCVSLERDDYLGVLATSSAELPGVLFTALLINWSFLGRRRTIALGFAATGFAAFLIFPCTTRGWETFFMFVIRAAISGAFMSVYVYTTEVYPTTIRTTGMGAASSIARIGGILTPYVAQVLAVASVYLALSTYSIVVLIAAVCSLLLVIETLGSTMPQNLKELEARMQNTEQGDEKERKRLREKNSDSETYEAA